MFWSPEVRHSGVFAWPAMFMGLKVELPSHCNASIARIVKGLFRRGSDDGALADRVSQPASNDHDRRRLLHDLNNILGVVVACFDEQIEILENDVENEILQKLAQDGLMAALRGAELIRDAQLNIPNPSNVHSEPRS